MPRSLVLRCLIVGVSAIVLAWLAETTAMRALASERGHGGSCGQQQFQEAAVRRDLVDRPAGARPPGWSHIWLIRDEGAVGAGPAAAQMRANSS